MSEVDKQKLRRIPLEALNQGRIEVVDEVVSEDYVERADTPGFSPDREGLKGFIAAVRTAFPDLKYTVIKEISEGDTLVQYVTASGTMKGDFGDMKATGKHATWEEVHIVRLEGGLAVEHWGVLDQLGMLQQLGLAPAPGMSRAA
jgi:predicted ester cyclase